MLLILLKKMKMGLGGSIPNFHGDQDANYENVYVCMYVYGGGWSKMAPLHWCGIDVINVVFW